jgi:hypothetical protein
MPTPSNVRRGFVEHGHLYGAPALLVDVGSPEMLEMEFIYSTARACGVRVHMVVRGERDSGTAAAALARYLRHARRPGQVIASASISPGVAVPDDPLAYASVYVVDAETASRVRPSNVDPRVASVSVHCWPGSSTMDVLSAQCSAPEGRHIIVEGDDVGRAKVWMQSNPVPPWKLMRAYDLNGGVERAEYQEMVADGQA